MATRSSARAEPIKAGNGVKIRLVGFGVPVGSDRYNIKLSSRRGYGVENEPIRDGVSPSVITIDGKGRTDPLVQTPDEVREPKNRRASVELVKQ